MDGLGSLADRRPGSRTATDLLSVWTRSSDPAADKLHWSCSPVFNSVPDRCADPAWVDAPSKFGCDESALVLSTEQQWGCRENASVLLTDRPSCCGQAVAELLSMVRTSFNQAIAAYRRLSHNIAGLAAMDGEGWKGGGMAR
jgi:hypothetical protein